jgi:predicted esterase
MSPKPFSTPRPLIIYWHASGGNSLEAPQIASRDELEAFMEAGGILAAPASEAENVLSRTFTWYLIATPREDDLLVADEIVACAVQNRNADPRRIHTAGWSAGGLQASAMGLMRSNYVASVLANSGGLLGPVPVQNPENKFAALLLHAREDFLIVDFIKTTEYYADLLRSAGHFALVCDHGGVHSQFPQDADVALQFFKDHPWGTDPSPYEDGAPPNFPVYCGGTRQTRTGGPPIGDSGPPPVCEEKDSGLGERCSVGTPCSVVGETCSEAVPCHPCLLECRDGAWTVSVCS